MCSGTPLAPEPHVDIGRLAMLVADGEAAREAGDWARAGEAQLAALALAEALPGESLGLAVVAQNLAVTFKYTGEFASAETLFRRALGIAEAHRADAVVATVCHNLGGLAHARGAFDEGVRWARHGLAARLRVAEDDPVALATDRGALASLLLELGDVEEAERLLRASRAGLVGALGEDHLEVAIVDGNLAVAALRRGDLAEAEQLARAALSGKRLALGPDHPTLASTCVTLATIRRRRGAPAESTALFDEAARVLGPAVLPDHPLLQTIERNRQAALRPRSRAGTVDED